MKKRLKSNTTNSINTTCKKERDKWRTKGTKRKRVVGNERREKRKRETVGKKVRERKR